jgi:hypothetical protein
MRVIADVKRGLFTPLVTGPCTDITLRIPEIGSVIFMRIDAKKLAHLRVQDGPSAGLSIDITLPKDDSERSRVSILLDALHELAGELEVKVHEELYGWWVNEYRQLKYAAQQKGGGPCA